MTHEATGRDALLGPAATEDAAVEVVCEHSDRCAGCPGIGLPYAEQLVLKRGRVVQSLSRYPALELIYTEATAPADPITEYRTRAKLIVSTGARLGLFGKGGGHLVVDIPRCHVLSPALQRVADAIRVRLRADEESGGPLAPFDPHGDGGRNKRGALRAVDLREVRGPEDDEAKVLVTFVVQRAFARTREELQEAARQLMRDVPCVAGTAVNFHEGDAPQILGSEMVVLEGVSCLPDRLGASTHLATFGSFAQAHRGQAGRVHAWLGEALDAARARAPERPPRVLDLYGGSGAIALALAMRGAEVVMVESFAPAVAHAQAAAAEQGVHLRAECADVATGLRKLRERGDIYDLAVVNPPRRGVSAAAREALARFNLTGGIAYVSCDPATLARDLDHLARLGYAAGRLRPLDMIPLTDEVETVALLRRVGIPLARVMYEDEEVLVADKGPHEPTTPQGEYVGSLFERVRRCPNAALAVPVHRIDVGTSGLVIFAKHPRFVEAWSQALHALPARKIYLAATRGVTPSKGAVTRDLREDGKVFSARTRYRRLAVASGHSVLRVIPEQGRTHQIRRHLAAIGHPVLGDNRYGHVPSNRFFEEKHGLDRAFLHCVRLELDHPRTGARLVIEAPLPGDLRAVLERTSGPGTLRFLDHKNALGGRAGISSLPPAPDALHERGSELEVDAARATDHPEPTSGDEGALGGGQ
jgi:23S rRNA (uracil1939-C5)-methyltransferase